MSAVPLEEALPMDQSEALAAAVCMLALAEPAIDPDGQLANALWPWSDYQPMPLDRRSALEAARGFIDAQLSLED